ncbi:MAG: type II secretion system F family protein [Candidatus Micrarchaeota archaeon]
MARDKEKKTGVSDFFMPKTEQKKKTVEKPPFFVGITRSLAKVMPSFGKNKKFTSEQQDAFNFLGWDVTAEQFYAAYQVIFVFGLAIGIAMAGAVWIYGAGALADESIRAGIAGIFVLVPIALSFMYLRYPYQAVDKEKVLALAYVPEIVNYLTMSLRLTPNLEKAVEFAANHGQGKIAEDMKKIVWDVQIGRFLSVEEALDDLAYRWGAYNEDFKHALMIIRASILEGDKIKREELLNKASDDVLEGAKEKMDFYSRKLHQPTVMLYYFGILLPLLLAIILPLAGSFANIALGKAEYLVIVYNLFLPIGIYFFGSNILSQRPPTYIPPNVPEDYPGLPPIGVARILGINVPFKWFALIVIVGLLYVGFTTDQGDTQNFINGILARFNPDFNPDFDGIQISGTLGQAPDYLTHKEALAQIPHFTYFDKNALSIGSITLIPQGTFIGQFTIFGLLIGFCLATSTWLLGKYAARKKIQDDLREMETEFKDALYVLASRLGENKPIEEALRSAVQFLPKSKVGRRIFRRVLENITMMGMTLDAAIFDETYGAMKDMPSRTIFGGMRFLSDSVELGVNVASKSLINLAVQLRNAQKIDEALRKMLEDVTVMLGTMAIFVAPVVLGVVSSMQRMIMNSLASTTPTSDVAAATQGITLSGVNVQGLTDVFKSSALSETADPTTFIFIMGIYVVEVVTLLTYFNSQIEDTRNNLHTWTSIAKALPVAIILYCVVVYITGQFLGGTG